LFFFLLLSSFFIFKKARAQSRAESEAWRNERSHYTQGGEEEEEEEEGDRWILYNSETQLLSPSFFLLSGRVRGIYPYRFTL